MDKLTSDSKNSSLRSGVAVRSTTAPQHGRSWGGHTKTSPAHQAVLGVGAWLPHASRANISASFPKYQRLGLSVLQIQSTSGGHSGGQI